MFENIQSDLKTYSNDWTQQGFWVLVVYRFGRWRYTLQPGFLRKFFSLWYKIAYKLIQILTGVELPCEVRIGKNFRIDHHSNIVISGYASFGDDCVIRNGVTVGLKNDTHPAAPQIGNNVNIGVGAKILGDISIGNNVFIGANAVVITDVPDNSIVVGVPAVVKSKPENWGRAPS
jgi:serine O-acetyltransferase